MVLEDGPVGVNGDGAEDGPSEVNGDGAGGWTGRRSTVMVLEDGAEGRTARVYARLLCRRPGQRLRRQQPTHQVEIPLHGIRFLALGRGWSTSWVRPWPHCRHTPSRWSRWPWQRSRLAGAWNQHLIEVVAQYDRKSPWKVFVFILAPAYTKVPKVPTLLRVRLQGCAKVAGRWSVCWPGITERLDDVPLGGIDTIQGILGEPALVG